MKITRVITAVILCSVMIVTAACSRGGAEPTPTPTPTEVPPMADLAVTSMTFNPIVGCAGDTVEATIMIENRGTLTSPACQWSLTIYEGKESLGTLPALPPGGGTIVRTTIALDSNIVGTFNATARADSMSVIEEPDKSNNLLTGTFAITICDYEEAYNLDREAIRAALIAYRNIHNDSTPLTGKPITLTYPAGTFDILDVCALIGIGDLLSEVPRTCADRTFDNCTDGTCSCHPGSHYIWLVDASGNLLSTCMGNECNVNSADGYQGVYP